MLINLYLSKKSTYFAPVLSFEWAEEYIINH